MRLKRPIILALVGASLIGGAAARLFLWPARPIGAGPVRLTVPASAFDRVWTERPVWFVGIGDSVTAGFGARPGYSYFDRLVSNPPDEFDDMKGICLRKVLPHMEVTNLAVSGSTSGEHLRRQIPRLPAGDSNALGIVVMTTGGNDLIHNYGRTPPREEAAYGATLEEASPWVANFEARLDQMVGQIQNHFPGGCLIFLATIFDPTDGHGDIEHAGLPPWKDGLKVEEAYNNVIRRCGQKHPFVHVVDVHETFMAHGIHCAEFWSVPHDRQDPHYWYYVNLEDPNERGYDAMRRLFLLQMIKVFDDAKR